MEVHLQESCSTAPWPRTLDDLRAEPARLVFKSDLLRMRIVKHEGMLKKLPSPLQVPSEKYAWEARTVLEALCPSDDSKQPTPPTRLGSWKPGQPLPKRADRADLAKIITHEFGPISPRSLEKWPLLGRRFNGRMVFDVQPALKLAEERFRSSLERKVA